MFSHTIASFYARDLTRMIEELNSFKEDNNIWRTTGTLKNSAGNLALHIIGGTNFLIGHQLANTGYVRNRQLEFTQKNVDRKILVSGLEALIPLIETTLHQYTDEDLQSDYPIPFDDAVRTKSYVLVQLLAHLNYHLGQMNYLRRSLE